MKCRFCLSENIVKYGKRLTKKGLIQRYLCKDCKKKFTENNGFIYSRQKPEIIISSLDLYFKGLSLRKVQDHLKMNYNIEISHVTILNWIRGYTKLIKNYVKDMKPISSDEWVADETMLFFKKHSYWFWDLIDKNTKFMIATQLTPYRFTPKENIFSMSRESTIGQPKVIFTDGLASYPKMIRDNFPNTRHERTVGIQDRGKTNVIERFHSSLKERYKVTRGFNCKNSGEIILEGWMIYYNFVRPHMSLNGKTPAEASGINLDLGENKWEGLIKQSVEVK